MCVMHNSRQRQDSFTCICYIFSQLHMRLPFDEFTIGVLCLLNVAPTQLHPNSWGYLQVFKLLCRSLYLCSFLKCFLYFYDTRLRDPIIQLSLVSRTGISILDAFSQSFKHFKDNFFKVVVKQPSRSLFYNEDGCTKFLFSLTDNVTPQLGMSQKIIKLPRLVENDNHCNHTNKKTYNLI